jgi:hypothetical protein
MVELIEIGETVVNDEHLRTIAGHSRTRAQARAYTLREEAS